MRIYKMDRGNPVLTARVNKRSGVALLIFVAEGVCYIKGKRFKHEGAISASLNLLLPASMGVIRTDESRRAEIEEFRRMLLSCSGVLLKVKVNTQDDCSPPPVAPGKGDEYTVDQKLVCVTSGVSFLGIAIVKQLLLRGYAVRIIVDNQEDVERLREIEVSGEMGGTSRSTSNNLIEVVVAKFNQRQSLLDAFDGCCAVFHTTAFIDPSGFSGYSKCMADIEARAAENIAEACAATSSVRNYVLTSSLLTCIWRDGNLPPVVDHNSWSDESFCNAKKLWYALGKLKAERVSWRIAEEKGLKLATICSALVTGPHYLCSNPSSTIAYLKGGQDMYESGLLATVDVDKLAEAHVRVHEEMKKTAGGRYVCFDKVVRSQDEVERLEVETGVRISRISGDAAFRYELSNRKLDRLMSQVHRCNNARGIKLDSTSCPRCSFAEETLVHCLFSCPVLVNFWSAFFSWVGFSLPQDGSVIGFLVCAAHAGKASLACIFWKGLVGSAAYLIWRDRNKLVFDRGCQRFIDLFHVFLSTSFSWVSARSKRVMVDKRVWDSDGFWSLFSS